MKWQIQSNLRLCSCFISINIIQYSIFWQRMRRRYNALGGGRCSASASSLCCSPAVPWSTSTAQRTSGPTRSKSFIKYKHPENIWWLIEDHAFLRSYDLAPPPFPHPLSALSASHLLFSVSLCVAGRAFGGGGGGWRRSQITKSYERLVLCKSFNTLWEASSGCGTQSHVL